jgi:hypothetical protein
VRATREEFITKHSLISLKWEQSPNSATVVSDDTSSTGSEGSTLSSPRKGKMGIAKIWAGEADTIRKVLDVLCLSDGVILSLLMGDADTNNEIGDMLSPSSLSKISSSDNNDAKVSKASAIKSLTESCQLTSTPPAIHSIEENNALGDIFDALSQRDEISKGCSRDVDTIKSKKVVGTETVQRSTERDFLQAPPGFAPFSKEFHDLSASSQKVHSTSLDAQKQGVFEPKTLTDEFQQMQHDINMDYDIRFSDSGDEAQLKHDLIEFPSESRPIPMKMFTPPDDKIDSQTEPFFLPIHPSIAHFPKHSPLISSTISPIPFSTCSHQNYNALGSISVPQAHITPGGSAHCPIPPVRSLLPPQTTSQPSQSQIKSGAAPGLTLPNDWEKIFQRSENAHLPYSSPFSSPPYSPPFSPQTTKLPYPSTEQQQQQLFTDRLSQQSQRETLQRYSYAGFTPILAALSPSPSPTSTVTPMGRVLPSVGSYNMREGSQANTDHFPYGTDQYRSQIRPSQPAATPMIESRVILQWPHPSFRFMFLGDPLKHQLNELLHHYRTKGLGLYPPIKDKSNPNACLLIEGKI